jgi:hypothetical protein
MTAHKCLKEKNVDDLEKAVFKGNGSPSLMADMAVVKKNIKILMGMQVPIIVGVSVAVIKIMFFGGVA